MQYCSLQHWTLISPPVTTSPLHSCFMAPQDLPFEVALSMLCMFAEKILSEIIFLWALHPISESFFFFFIPVFLPCLPYFFCLFM